MGSGKDECLPGDAEDGWPPDEQLTEGQLADKMAGFDAEGRFIGVADDGPDDDDEDGEDDR
jgi:hypothetical protein